MRELAVFTQAVESGREHRHTAIDGAQRMASSGESESEWAPPCINIVNSQIMALFTSAAETAKA